jgi:hypothetical protein
MFQEKNVLISLRNSAQFFIAPIKMSAGENDG